MSSISQVTSSASLYNTKEDPSGNDVGQMRMDLEALAQAITQLNNDAAALNPPIANGQDLQTRLGDDLASIQALASIVSGDIAQVQSDAADGDPFAVMTVNKPSFRLMLAALTGNVSGEGSLLGDTSSKSLANLLAFELQNNEVTNFSSKINGYINAR